MFTLEIRRTGIKTLKIRGVGMLVNILHKKVGIFTPTVGLRDRNVST